MVMHSKACHTFSCRAARQRVSVPVPTRGGPHAGRGSGPGLDAIAHDGRHRMLAAHPAGQAARVPRRLPAVTLIEILPAARPRYARAARAQPPPALAPGLCHHDREPERETPAPIDDRVQQLITGQQRRRRDADPPGGVPARDSAAPSLARSHPGGPARVRCRRGGSRAYRLRPGAAAREPRPCRPDPRSSRPAFPRLPGCRPRQDVPAGQNQARPLHV
jgi:hypothetical protein